MESRKVPKDKEEAQMRLSGANTGVETVEK